MITKLNDRSREVFRHIVNSYLELGLPVGSKTIADSISLGLSSASIRNTMAELEHMGMLRSPHTSAGRIPTELGLRFYIDGLMEVGNLSEEERKKIDAECSVKGLSTDKVMNKTLNMLTNLSSCASLVIAPNEEDTLKQIQFVPLEPGKALIILVFENGMIENRFMHVPTAMDESTFVIASNYLNSKVKGLTIAAALKDIQRDIQDKQNHLDAITKTLISKGIETYPVESGGHMILRGQSKLLEDVKAIEDLERARGLLNYLEEQENMKNILDLTKNAQGVQIYIGTENEIFDQSGWSLIISPYNGTEGKIVGAIGVIGPTRLDYDRIIPMVDYTSRIIAKIVDEV